MIKRVLLVSVVFLLHTFFLEAQPSLERQPGYLHFEEFALFNEIESSMEFHIGESLLRLVANAAEYESKELASVLRKLKLIRSYTFDLSGRPQNEAEMYTEQFNRKLLGDRWDIVFRTREKDTSANIYIKEVDEKVAGLTLLSIEKDHKITVVNIVGEVNLDELSSLAQRFGFPDLNNNR
jgi:hypothetical protein